MYKTPMSPQVLAVTMIAVTVLFALVIAGYELFMLLLPFFTSLAEQILALFI